MARTVNGGTANLGRALANIVGTVVTHALNATAQHQQAQKTEGFIATAQHVADGMAGQMSDIAGHCLDTGAVHPLLEPIFKAMKGE